METPVAAPVVEPKVGVMPPPAGAGTPPAAESGEPKAGAELPNELLQIPAIQGLLAGSPPAVSASLADFANRPEGKLIAANKEPLMNAGMGLYRSVGGDIGVIFNRMFVSDQEISNADKAGQLPQVAPPFDQVNQQLASAGQNHPILNPNLQTPTGLKTAPPAAVGAMPAASPAPGAMPAPTPAKVTAAKARNIPLGSPTSGPKPGAGRLLNSILKPVV